VETTAFPIEKDDYTDAAAAEIDDVLDEKGLHALFGTLCHYVLQKKIEGNFDPAAIPFTIRENIDGVHFSTFLSEALRFSDLFFDSDIGAELKQAEEVETEVPFVYCWGDIDDPVYFHGRIDVLFQTADRAYVVDFKTDRNYSPYRHGVQIEIYRRAAEELTGKPSQGVLFYVRDGTAVAPDAVGAEERVKRFLQAARKGKRED
jgi:ATP-dependent exoDNAse (exonuclease V) beta subunit